MEIDKPLNSNRINLHYLLQCHTISNLFLINLLKSFTLLYISSHQDVLTYPDETKCTVGSISRIVSKTFQAILREFCSLFIYPHEICFVSKLMRQYQIATIFRV